MRTCSRLGMGLTAFLAAAPGCGGETPGASTTAATAADAGAVATLRPDAAADGAAAAVAPRDAAACVPTGPEICDGKDNDCDGVIDNGLSYQGSHVGSACYPRRRAPGRWSRRSASRAARVSVR